MTMRGSSSWLLALLLAACAAPQPSERAAEAPAPAAAAAAQPVPPVAAMRAHAVASPNGARNDDYYWLRDDERKAPEVLAYLEAENA